VTDQKSRYSPVNPRSQVYSSCFKRQSCVMRSCTASIPVQRNSEAAFSYRPGTTTLTVFRKDSTMTVRALVFDAYGALYDVQSVCRVATELCGDKGEIR